MLGYGVRRTFRTVEQIKAGLMSHRLGLLPIAQELERDGNREAAECVRTAIAALDDAREAA